MFAWNWNWQKLETSMYDWIQLQALCFVTITILCIILICWWVIIHLIDLKRRFLSICCAHRFRNLLQFMNIFIGNKSLLHHFLRDESILLSFPRLQASCKRCIFCHCEYAERISVALLACSWTNSMAFMRSLTYSIVNSIFHYENLKTGKTKNRKIRIQTHNRIQEMWKHLNFCLKIVKRDLLIIFWCVCEILFFIGRSDNVWAFNFIFVISACHSTPAALIF